MAPAGAYAAWIALAAAALGIIEARRRAAAPWQPFALATVAMASVVAFAFVSWGRATPLGDFNKAYYPAGTAIFTDPSRLYGCDAANLCFVNVPIVAAVFAPLTAMGRLPAQVVFSIAGAAAAAAAAWLLIRELHADGPTRYAIVALFALNGPLLYSARLGNLTHVMLPLVVVAFAALTRGRDGRGGVLFGVLALIKPPLVLFVAYLIFRRRWRAVLAAITTTIAAGVVSVAAVGLEPHRIWLTQVIGPFANRPVAAYNVQSIAGMLAHFRRPEDLASWVPLEVSRGFMVMDYALIALVLIAVAITLLAGGPPLTRSAQWAELSIVLVVVLLVSPLTWTHYYAFLVIPLACYATGAMIASSAAARLAIAAGAALVSAPAVLWLPHVRILGSLIARLGTSHYVFGALMLLGALCATRVANREPAVVACS
jgi:hypothetical protein